MAQMTSDLAHEALRYCAHGRHPPLTAREIEQLLQAWLERPVLTAQRDHARAQVDGAVKLLVGVHALMYPAVVVGPDGRQWQFRPRDPDPHVILQELSDRIRALPDKLKAIQETKL